MLDSPMVRCSLLVFVLVDYGRKYECLSKVRYLCIYVLKFPLKCPFCINNFNMKMNGELVKHYEANIIGP